MKLLIFIIFLCGCSQSNSLKIHHNEVSQVTIDSLIWFTEKEFKVIELEKRGDTLLIVSTNRILFYPFGKYPNFEEFKDEYLIKHGINVKIDSAFNIFRIFSIDNNMTNVKLIENTETKKLELFTATINDNSFELFYDIRIGMKKDEVFLKFFVKTPSELNRIRTIKIVSGLEGIWYYFNFSTKELLENIIIESDYIIN
ncbi:MAG: hypothetical protein Q8S18_09160 [Bacteroidales bacterium]|nr:hypothetical protein [Bacteroidales bacterium]